jgi:hypothetical protein
MGVLTSEVGYTSATTGMGDHEVHKGHVVALGRKKMFTLEEAMNAPTRSRYIALLFLQPRRNLWGMGGQGHATAAFFPMPIVQEVECAQGRSGWLQKASSLLGFDPGPFGP